MQSQAAAAVVTMDTDLQRHGEIGRLKEEGGGGGCKWLQLHSTFSKTKEMLNGC